MAGWWETILKGPGAAKKEAREDYKRKHGGEEPPTTREHIQRGIKGAVEKYGPEEWNRFENTSGGFAEDLTGTLEATTPVGLATAADDFSRAEGLKEKGLAGAGLAMSLIPGARAAKKPVAEGVEKASQFLLKKEGKKVAKEATEEGGQFALKGKKAKAPKQEAITAVSLRDKPMEEAVRIAKSERHIIPKTEGGFVGAPYSAKTREDLDMIRQKFDEDVASGAGGADWYPRAQEWIKQVAGDDPARQSELARNLALFSAQADPKGNLGFSVKARNNAIMGMVPESSEGVPGVVRTGQQWRTYLDAYNSGDPIELGPKTGIYAGHMDPTQVNPVTGTNDIWHARALGYETPEGTPWESALTPQQHSFMDAETVLAMDRANKAGTGGRTDWTPGEVQAAPWVAGKGRGLAEEKFYTKKKDVGQVQGPLSQQQLQAGYAEAGKTYPDYAKSFTGYGTHEMTPGASTGHLTGLADDPALKQAYADDPRSWWADPKTGRDILYDAQGAYVAPTAPNVGIFEETPGNIVYNPGNVAQPLIAHSGPTGERVVDPASRQMMSGTEGFRALVDAQDAGAWSANIPGQKMGHMNAYELNLTPEQQTREGLADVMTRGAAVGQPNVVHQGGSTAMITDFMGDEGLTSKGGKAVQAKFPGAVPVRREGDYLPYQEAWQKGEGSEAATNQMLAGLTPAQEKGLDSPAVRANILGKLERDMEMAAQTGKPIRQDLQTFRRIFAAEGFAGIRKAIGQNILPVSAGAMFLPYLASEEDKT